MHKQFFPYLSDLRISTNLNLSGVWKRKILHISMIIYQSLKLVSCFDLIRITRCNLPNIEAYRIVLISFSFRTLLKVDLRHLCSDMSIKVAENKAQDRHASRNTTLRQLSGSVNIIMYIFTCLCLCKCYVWWPGQNKRIAPLSFFHGCRTRRL
jgi:hypothetical protein